MTVAVRRNLHWRDLARTVAIAVTWGLMMSGGALAALLLDQGRELDPRTAQIAVIYLAGGFIGMILMHPVLLLAQRSRSQALRFVLILLTLGGLTLAATAGIFALDYRTYYAEWHGDAFTKIWFFQFFFTALSSTYQYLVIGSRLYWPLGPVFLLLMSWWLSRRAS